MSDDRAGRARRLREQADEEDRYGKRYPHYAKRAQRLRERADRVEAGEPRTARDFVDDYNDDAERLHTGWHVEDLEEHAEKWEVEVRVDTYTRALEHLASAHATLMSHGERHAADIVAGCLIKAHEDLAAINRDTRR